MPRLFPQMTVLENLMLVPLRQAGERFWNNWARAGRVRREERLARERAMEVLELCDLGDKAGEIAGRLSGGQQKLLELARVLVAEPKLYLGAGRCRVPVTGEGGTTEKECSPTTGQQLLDLKKAYDAGVISSQEYEAMRESILRGQR